MTTLKKTKNKEMLYALSLEVIIFKNNVVLVYKRQDIETLAVAEHTLSKFLKLNRAIRDH